jgi:serine/threonine-protein kinase
MVAERYKLERELARGGMGTVWQAFDTKLGRQVAVKVMAQELAQMSEAQQRFEREARTVAQLRSRHVVEVYDFGTQEGLPFIVMELLEGQTLAQRLKLRGRLPVDEVARVVQQVCKGLKAAHSAGLIHRDLKPSNIFLAERDDEEVGKLLDFGVVKAVDTMGSSDATASGMLLGTPQYMSPEQARAKRQIDHRSDLWSIAVIVFRMLTGVNPFRGESVGDVVLKICSDELPQIAEHAQGLPPGLDGFFERALARKPDERFQSADELSQAFHAIVAPGVNPLGQTASGTPAHPNALRPPAGAGALPPPNPPPGRASSSGQAQPLGVLALGAPAGGPDAPTPVSTTVGGTPIASILPLSRPPEWAMPLIVAGAVLTLVLAGLAAAFWGDEGGGEPLTLRRVLPTAPVLAAEGTINEGIAAVESDIDSQDEPDAGAAPSASAKASATPRSGGRSPRPPTKPPPSKPDTKPKWF